MNEISVINESEILGQRVDIYGTPDEPLFLARDVAEWIEYDLTSTNKMLSTIDDEEKLLGTIFRSGQNRETWFLTEDGLYEVLMQSRKPKAKVFKSGVKNILKSIRKTGGYIAGQESMDDDQLMAQAILVAQRRIAERDQVIALQSEKIVKLEPKARFADAIGQADNCISVGEMAKLLCQNGYQTGQRRLFDMLHREGFVMRNSQGRYIPQQNSMNLGIMRIKETLMVFNNEAFTVPTIQITPKGQQYFINRYVITPAQTKIKAFSGKEYA